MPKWPNTEITDLLHITLPIIQAPMAGGATTPELVAAVSNAGGLGSFAAGYLSPDEMKLSIKQIRQLTDKPFAVNLFIPEKHDATIEQIDFALKVIQAVSHELHYVVNPVSPPFAPSFDEQMAVILDEKIPVFSFTFGIPRTDWIAKLKHAGIKLLGTATTLQEAKMLQEQGIDVIVAQGSEAGGHRGTFLSRAEDALLDVSTLVTTLVDQVNIPVVASGGIMNARGIADLIRLGASGVQMGTVFLTCTESGIHPRYKELLLKTKHDNTTLTRAFSGKLARGITNKFMTRMKAHEDSILDYPIQNKLTNQMRRQAAMQNNTDFMSMWAGQAACMCKVISAADLILELQAQ